MSTFEERENRFESEFAHDATLKFKAEARRNKIVGQWAAEKLDLSGEKADEYVKTVLAADFEEEGDEDVFRKLRSDLDKAREKISDDDIRSAMNKALSDAVAQIKAGE